MNILMISSAFPYPPTRGGTQGRTFNLLKYLSKNHDITLIVQRTADVSDAARDLEIIVGGEKAISVSLSQITKNFNEAIPKRMGHIL